MSIDDELRELRKNAWSWARRCQRMTPTKFQGNECDETNGGSGVGDSVLFSAILYYSGESWAGESVKKSQGDDGRMWRAPQRVGKDSEPTFSRDHLLGAMLYMVTLKNRGHGDEAATFGNKLWEWVTEKRRNELQKALDEVSSISILKDLIRNPRATLDTIIGGIVPSRYRICNGEDGVCSISLIPYGHWGKLMHEVWTYIGAETSISKSISRSIPIPLAPDISIPIDFDLGEFSALDYNTLFTFNGAGVLAGELVGKDRSFLDHLSVVTAILLDAMGKSNSVSKSTVDQIAGRNENPFFLLAAGRVSDSKTKVLELCPKTQPPSRNQWAWERAYSDKAWESSFGWDFIAAINLLLGDTYFEDAIIFDAHYYIDRYPDLKAAFGTDFEAATQHWLNQGLSVEGRIGSPVFDVRFYIDRYPDLKAAFGTDFNAATKH